jgi:ribosome maturation factor RimP
MNLDEYIGKKVKVEIDMVCEAGKRKSGSFSGVLRKDEHFGIYLLQGERDEIMIDKEIIRKIQLID